MLDRVSLFNQVTQINVSKTTSFKMETVHYLLIRGQNIIQKHFVLILKLDLMKIQKMWNVIAFLVH